jgi:hypothetical protein
MGMLDERKRLLSLISENKYISSTTSNNGCRDTTSISSLIDRKLTQSDCIKLGNGIEKILRDVISAYNTDLENIKPLLNKRGKKDMDHLFYSKYEKTIYYAEVKTNINLDTEKVKATCEKCTFIVKELKKMYPDHTIKWCILGCRYLAFENAPHFIKKKYLSLVKNNHLMGINEYLLLLRTNLTFSEMSYKLFLNDIANAMFK